MSNTKLISISSFVEYAYASPQRRQRIIESVLTPPKYLLDTKYPDIERASAFYIASGCENTHRLEELDNSLSKITAKSEHQENRLLTAHDAIEISKNLTWPIPSKATIQTALDLPTDLAMGELQIRVKPTVLIRQCTLGRKEALIGVAKPYFKKTSSLRQGGDPERGILYATIMHQYAETVLSHIGVSDPKLCLVGDVFAEEFHFAARRFKQRRKQIEALALEISDRWEIIRDRSTVKDVKVRSFK